MRDSVTIDEIREDAKQTLRDELANEFDELIEADAARLFKVFCEEPAELIDEISSDISGDDQDIYEALVAVLKPQPFFTADAAIACANLRTAVAKYSKVCAERAA